MAQNCCVPDCKTTITCPSVSLHYLPKDERRLQIWVPLLTKNIEAPFVPSGWARICSSHFRESCFTYRGHKRILTSAAIPTRVPWIPCSYDDKASTEISKKVGQHKVPECDSTIQETSLSYLTSSVSQSAGSAVLMKTVPNRKNDNKEKLDIKMLTNVDKQMKPDDVAEQVYEGIFPDLNYCLVNGCFNTNNTPNVTLHSVPDSNSARYRKWVGLLKIDKRKSCISLPGNYICSVHFDESSFLVCNGEKKLSEESVPSIFPWTHCDLNVFGSISQQNLSMTLEKSNNPLIHEDNLSLKCGNCNIFLDANTPPVRILEIQDSITGLPNDVQIPEVISYIYQINWHDFSKQLPNSDVMHGRLFEATVEGTNYSSPLDFCYQCASTLEAAYVAHKDFERLTKSESIVHSAKLFQQQWRNTEAYKEVKSEVNCDSLFDHFNCDSENFPIPLNNDLDVKCKVEIEERDENVPVTEPDYPTIIPMEPPPNDLYKDMTEEENCYVRTVFYICEICNETFTSKDSWISHKRLHHEKISSTIPYNCPVCTKPCKNYIHFKYFHLLSHKNDKIQPKCKLCLKQVRSRKHLTRHMKKAHNKKAKLRIGRTCTKCKKIIFAKGEKIMEAHMKTHSKILFRCLVCRQQFTKASELKTHILSHPDSSECLKVIQCPFCPEMFPSVQEMKAHKEKHKEKVPFFCNHCKRPFYFKDALIKHELQHLKERDFKCDKCNASFYDKGTLVRHQTLLHSEVQEVVCHLCGGTYKNNLSLKSHLKTHDDKAMKKEYKCDECGLILANKQILGKHKLDGHLRRYIYKCSICGQRLANKRMLNRHEECHETDPNFKGRPRISKYPKHEKERKSDPSLSSSDEEKEKGRRNQSPSIILNDSDTQKRQQQYHKPNPSGQTRNPKCLKSRKSSVNSNELSGHVLSSDEDNSEGKGEIPVQGCSGFTRRFITYPGRKKDKPYK